MNIQRLSSAAASLITVTTTATSLYSLIDTAAGLAQNLSKGLDALDIAVESGNIRMLCDGNAPTATQGFLLVSGKIHRIRGIPLSQIQLICATGTTQTASIMVGISTDGDQSESSG